MRIFGFIVAKDEAERYLDFVLFHNGWGLDGLFFYDDQSADATREIAEWRFATVARRPDSVPSFVEHEGRFRQAAWEAFEEAMLPTPEDWILAFDADEVLVCSTPGRYEAERFDNYPALEASCKEAVTRDALAVILQFHEVFAVGEDLEDLEIRVDGYWGTIAGPRLFRYQPGGRIRDSHYGCGSVPTYVMPGTAVAPTEPLSFLHFGYALSADQLRKYERYVGHAGHSADHIESILRRPSLQTWWGPRVGIWRGRA
jgi:hypothetical protein